MFPDSSGNLETKANVRPAPASVLACLVLNVTTTEVFTRGARACGYHQGLPSEDLGLLADLFLQVSQNHKSPLKYSQNQSHSLLPRPLPLCTDSG